MLAVFGATSSQRDQRGSRQRKIYRPSFTMQDPPTTPNKCSHPLLNTPDGSRISDCRALLMLPRLPLWPWTQV